MENNKSSRTTSARTTSSRTTSIIITPELQAKLDTIKEFLGTKETSQAIRYSATRTQKEIEYMAKSKQFCPHCKADLPTKQ